jgi:hypothetical protein
MNRRKLILKRIMLSMGIGLLIGFALSEISFQFLKEINRAPQTVTMEIPEGTSELVAQGLNPPSIPEDMVFVVGDVLVVNNYDQEDHQLGPMWIPAGGTASLRLDEEQNFIFKCSFNPKNAFGIDVQEPVTLETRLSGIFFAGVPMGAILALYSVVIWPIKSEVKASDAEATVQ